MNSIKLEDFRNGDGKIDLSELQGEESLKELFILHEEAKGLPYSTGMTDVVTKQIREIAGSMNTARGIVANDLD